MILAGIDLSMNGPAIAKFDTSKNFCFKNIQFYYLTTLKKYQCVILDNVVGAPIKDYSTNEERWNNIAEWCLASTIDCDIVNIEGMSFGATSNSLAQIGEMTGVVKHKWFLNNIKINVTPPTQNKKAFSGKGNATKGDMIDTFIKKFDYNIIDLFKINGSNLHPVEDICHATALLDYQIKQLA